jgi:hypothetical protein
MPVPYAELPDVINPNTPKCGAPREVAAERRHAAATLSSGPHHSRIERQGASKQCMARAFAGLRAVSLSVARPPTTVSAGMVREPGHAGQAPRDCEPAAPRYLARADSIVTECAFPADVASVFITSLGMVIIVTLASTQATRRSRSWAHSILRPPGFTTPSPRLVRGRLRAAFSLSPQRSGDVLRRRRRLHRPTMRQIRSRRDLRAPRPSRAAAALVADAVGGDWAGELSTSDAEVAACSPGAAVHGLKSAESGRGSAFQALKSAT